MTGALLTAAGVGGFVWALRSNRRTLLARRADQQHEWVKAGDPRGTYGDPHGVYGGYFHE
jgi:hypothetical protein